MVQPQHHRKRTHAPQFGHRPQNATLPQMAAQQQFAPQSLRHLLPQHLLLFAEGRFELGDLTPPIGDYRPAAGQCRMHEVEQVRPPHAGAFRRRQLPRQQVDQPAHVSRGTLPGPLLIEGPQRIDIEHVGNLVPIAEMIPPVLADVLVEVGMRLHEHQPTAGRRLAQLIDNACRAILLLRRRVDEHIAVR